MVFNYVFASDEYLEYVVWGFNDVFGWFLNGVNIATIPNTNSTPVAIRNVNAGVNPKFFRKQRHTPTLAFRPRTTLKPTASLRRSPPRDRR